MGAEVLISIDGRYVCITSLQLSQCSPERGSTEIALSPLQRSNAHVSAINALKTSAPIDRVGDF